MVSVLEKAWRRPVLDLRHLLVLGRCDFHILLVLVCLGFRLQIGLSRLDSHLLLTLVFAMFLRHHHLVVHKEYQVGLVVAEEKQNTIKGQQQRSKDCKK